MSKRVYLAGPITGLSYGECVDWREWAILELEKSGIVGVSPMRAKDFLANDKPISALGQYDGDQLGLGTIPSIVTRDRWDVMRSDLILMNLFAAKSVSIGTMVELGWADAFRKPVVLVMEPNSVHAHVFVTGLTGFKATTLHGGITLVRAILERG